MTVAEETTAVSREDTPSSPTLALNTKVEEDFVAPLASVRGALEILRDFSDLDADERLRFVETALRGCARLQKGVDELGRTVYEAGQQTRSPAPGEDAPIAGGDDGFAGHVRFFDDSGIVEIDFAGLVFKSSTGVNDFFDAVERRVEDTGRRWYFLVNYGGYSIWPEAWIAFAHRGKQLNVTFSLGTARYDESTDGDAGGSGEFSRDFFATREAALAHIEQMKSCL